MTMQFENNQQFYPKNFYLVGTSYRRLALDERELLAMIESKEKDLLLDLKEASLADELAMISTCNRFEVVAVYSKDKTPEADASKNKILSLLQRRLGRSLKEDDFYSYNNRDAIRHLFSVASSLDSMVLGEGQILGQVKNSYKRCVEQGCAGKFLHHLFQFSFYLAKKVRSNTNLGEKGVSVSYIAVKLAEQIFGELQGRSVLVIGSGQMAELAALHLRTHGAGEIVVANRTLEKALELAGKIKGSAISLSEIEYHLPRVDIVLSSIAQVDKPLIEVNFLRNSKRDSSLLLLDLGVPRNFSPLLGDFDDVYLYNIDDLSDIAEQNKKLRQEAAAEAQVLIDYGLLQFEKWLHKVNIEPAILDLREKVFKACKSEIKEVLKKYVPAMNLEEALAALSDRLGSKLAHDLSQLINNADSVELKDDLISIEDFISAKDSLP